VEQAENAAGKSAFSYETIIVAAELPSKANLIEKVSSLSNKTSIHVKWSRVPNTETETTGYLLKMAEYGSSDF
jgi:Fibronectin type III domain